MPKIYGRFYYKQTQNLNLLGEFSNYTTFRNHTESADINHTNDSEMKISPQPFIGEYTATYQTDNEAYLLKLSISYKSNSNNSIFTLKWTDKSNKTVFEGEGFLVDNLLVGDYSGN